MRVIVVGAGLAGLSAATELTRSGHDVVVFDKGRSPGGRMATRRIGAARLDHGAQFFTVRSDTFAAMVQPFLDEGLVFEWNRGFGADDGYPRYAVRGGMNELCKRMAAPRDVRCNTMAFAVHRATAGAASADALTLLLDDGTRVAADAMVMTCPLPQSYSLLVTAELDLPETLVRTDYDRTIALLVTMDGLASVPEPGGRQHPTEVLSFVADNQRKGISPVPAVTLHANAEWSEAHWNDDRTALVAALLDAGREFLGDGAVVEAQLKKWRMATPRSIWPEPCWLAESAPVVLAGDAFAGPKVEGAVLSGLAAAQALSSR